MLSSDRFDKPMESVIFRAVQMDKLWVFLSDGQGTALSCEFYVIFFQIQARSDTVGLPGKPAFYY